MYHSICNMNRCSLVNGYEAEGNARPEPSSPPSNPSAALDRSSSESRSRAARFNVISIGVAFIKRHFDTLRVDRRTIRHTAYTSLYLFR